MSKPKTVRIPVGPNAAATFTEKPSDELLALVKKMVSIAKIKKFKK